MPLTAQENMSLTDQEIIYFVRENPYKYLSKFKKFNIAGVDHFTPTWNWSAFLFSDPWLLYRKLYFWALITFILSLIPGINIIVFVLWGICGNYVYYKHVKKKILALKTSNPYYDVHVLSKVGGVNTWVIPVFIILSIIFLFLKISNLISVINQYINF